MLEEIADLKARWMELYPQFSAVREAMLATVVRWEWAYGQRYDPRPFYFKREALRGHVLKQVRAEDEYYFRIWHIGYDAQGRTVVSIKGSVYETFYVAAGDGIEIYEHYAYQEHQQLRGIGYLHWQNRHLSQFKHFVIGGHVNTFNQSPPEIWQTAEQAHGTNFTIQREDYHYTGKHLTGIEQANWRHSYLYPASPQVSQKHYDLEYNSAGKLEHITRSITAWNGITDSVQTRTRTIYTRGETFGELQRRLAARLIDVIPAIIKEANFTEPLYAVWLKYAEVFFFPPRILPCFESVRNRLLAALSEKYQGQGWRTWTDVGEHTEDADPFYDSVSISDAETLALCDKFQYEIERNLSGFRAVQAVRKLRQVARALNQLDWSQYIPVTPDFIVYAYDQDNITEALRYSGATREQIVDWKKRGFL